MHLKSQDYIARFGHGSAKLARQAQSKEKTMAKMVAGGLTEKVVTEKVGLLTKLDTLLKFQNCDLQSARCFLRVVGIVSYQVLKNFFFKSVFHLKFIRNVKLSTKEFTLHLRIILLLVFSFFSDHPI